MNKLILLNIMKDIIYLHQKNELNEDTFNNTINKFFCNRPSDDEIAYEEATFISYLFENIPYYKLMITINNILITLNMFNLTSKQKCIKDLIEAYLSDLLPSITARLSTETNAHIQELITIFYQRDELPYHDTIKRLKRNVIKPSFLASIDTAEQKDYKQETIFNFDTPKDIPLRESISRSNFTKKSSIERTTTKAFTKYYNEELYQKLISSLKEVIHEYSLEDELDSDYLKDEILPSLNNLHQKAKKKWEEPKPIDEYQYTLKLN